MSKRTTLKEFIKKSISVHNNKYDYSFVEYINNRTKVKIICPEHGVWEQVPLSHTKGFGCPKCAGCFKSNNKEFIRKSNEVHNEKYLYDKVEYKNAKTKVIITCKIHGNFEQTPNKHLQVRGCPRCNNSKSENLIEYKLNQLNIKYITQKKFDDCKYKRLLPFDFYLPDYNMCIEYDGEQHFRPHKVWGEKKMYDTKRNDKIKNIYCEENKINLIRIRYDENINEKIDEIIKI